MIKIPKKVFEMHCENGDTACPEPGDMVPLDGLTGKVVASDDAFVTIEPTEFNGAPVESDDPAADDASAQEDPANADSKQKADLLQSLQNSQEE